MEKNSEHKLEMLQALKTDIEVNIVCVCVYLHCTQPSTSIRKALVSVCGVCGVHVCTCNGSGV